MNKVIAVADDPVKTDPEKYKVVFENDQIRMLDYNDKPGDKTRMHSHPEHLIYSLGPWKRKFIFPDGKAIVAEGKAGDTLWQPEQTHAGENVGTVDTHVLIIEFK